MECKRIFESVKARFTSIPFDIVAIAINTSSQAELLAFFPSSVLQQLCLLSGLLMAMRR